MSNLEKTCGGKFKKRWGDKFGFSAPFGAAATGQYLITFQNAGGLPSFKIPGGSRVSKYVSKFRVTPFKLPGDSFMRVMEKNKKVPGRSARKLFFFFFITLKPRVE